MLNGSQRHNDKGRAKTSLENILLTLFVTFACERELETEQNCNILTPTLMAVSVVSFSFSRAAQPEARGLSFLLSAGFLYHILSPTSLIPNSIGSPEGPFGLAWPSLPHLVSNSNSSGAPRAPSAGLSLPHLISNFPGPQLTDFLSSQSYITIQRPHDHPLDL